jgi:hypothetical protein
MLHSGREADLREASAEDFVVHKRIDVIVETKILGINQKEADWMLKVGIAI